MRNISTLAFLIINIFVLDMEGLRAEVKEALNLDPAIRRGGDGRGSKL